MTTDLKDLLSGQPVRKGDNALVPGRWWWPSCPAGAVMNGIEVADGDRVVPRRDRSWSLQCDRLARRDGEFSQRVIASSADTDALSQMNEQFEARLASRAVWDDWVAASPLAPRLDDYLRIRTFDEILEENLVFLETVCATPRTHLKVESDLVPTARARRVARQAIARLASHREDWERPTVLGVRPRRVLCLVPDENADIYENRLAARLVDHIRLYLQVRLARLADIRRMLSQISDHASGAASGHHWRRDRLYALWAGAVQDDAAVDVAVHTQARLDALYIRVLGLLDSPLYRAVPHGAPVSGLRYTNILSNDPHYRKVATLWKRWTELGAERPLSDQQVYERQQSVCSAMSWFSWLVVVRAAEQLHLQPEASFQSTTVDDIPIQLVGPVADCTITPPRDAVVTIRCGNVAIRVVGVPAVLDGETGGDIESQRRQLGDAATGASEDHVLLLHLPASRVQASSPAELHPTANWHSACAWEPGTTHGTKLSILPISPWDIASVERVARYLRWHLHAPQLLAYPPKVRCSIPGTPAGMEWTVRGENRHEWRVLRRPKPREKGLADLLSTARDALYKATASAGGKAAQHARRDADERAEQCRAQIDTAFASIDKLCVCPVCWEAHGNLELLDLPSAAFSVECPGCSSVWGVFRCRCGTRFPVIQLQNIERLVNGSSFRGDGWIDALLGCDVLSVPCHQSRGKVSLVCPSCKQCACSAHSPQDDTLVEPG
ncbi:MAG: hypothetical protein KF912_14835 [Phycisphaeraceae bacterium]|nr:hypothetical protein [Phycisphaeraceae bacterium]